MRRVREVISCTGVLFLAAVRIIIFFICAAAPASAADGFVPLFNGRDLSGWIEQKKQGQGWTVRDGLLISPAGSVSNLYTEKLYSDFILQARFRLDPQGNNGIGIRAGREGGNPSTTGMEIQILDDYHATNAKLPLENMCGSIYRLVPSRRGALRPAGEWNDVEIRAIGRRIEVALNGRDVLRTDLNRLLRADKFPEQPGFIRFSGHIALLGHKPSAVAFRDIEILDLGRSYSPQQPPDGLAALFDGRSLDGWTLNGIWAVQESAFGCAGAGLASPPGAFRDFELMLDWQIPPGGAAALHLPKGFTLALGGGKDPAGTLTGDGRATKPERPASPAAGDWNSLHLSVARGKLSVFINGELVHRGAAVSPAAQGPLLLESGGAGARFRNLFLRQLMLQ